MSPLRIKRWLRLLVWAHQYVANLADKAIEISKKWNGDFQYAGDVTPTEDDKQQPFLANFLLNESIVQVLKQTFSDTSADVLADDEEMLRDYFGTDSVGLSATVKLLYAEAKLQVLSDADNTTVLENRNI